MGFPTIAFEEGIEFMAKAAMATAEAWNQLTDDQKNGAIAVMFAAGGVVAAAGASAAVLCACRNRIWGQKNSQVVVPEGILPVDQKSIDASNFNLS